MTLSATILTQELIRFRSVNPPGNEEPCMRHLGGILESAGFDLKYVPMGAGRTNLVARKGGDETNPALAFTGHLDTVPLGMQDWSVDPFAADIFGGRIYGRGASDMKSGVAAFVVAAANMATHLADGRPGVELIMTAGEEAGCDGARAIAQTPGVLGGAGALVVAEPTSNRPLVGHKGAFWLEGRTRGVTAHGSMPEQGDNAIYKAADAICKLRAFEFGVPAHPVLGGPTLNIGTISGGLNPNSVPDAARFTIDLRTIPAQIHEQLLATLSDYVGSDVVLSPLVDVPGIWTDPDDPWIVRVFAAVEKVTGAGPQVEGVQYFTDASILTPALGGVPTTILGPGEAAMAHQTDEYCEVERIEQAQAIYEALIADWCAI